MCRTLSGQAWRRNARVVSRAGVEPTTFPLGGGRSIQLSYRDMYAAHFIAITGCALGRFGDDVFDRTGAAKDIALGVFNAQVT
jgi:hypothetical protein